MEAALASAKQDKSTWKSEKALLVSERDGARGQLEILRDELGTLSRELASAEDAMRTSRVCTVGPLIIESLWAKKRVSTGALGPLDDPFVVQTKVRKSDSVPVDITLYI